MATGDASRAAGRGVPDPDALRAAFEGAGDGTVGLEEEVLLVDAVTWAPVPAAAEVVAAAADPRIKLELPACQVELATVPHATVAAAAAELADLRRILVRSCPPTVRPCAAAVHPFATGPMAVTDSPRSEAITAEYGEVARRQLVGALQVHVAVGDADVALAVYNALRGYLPEIAALAAAAPFAGGRDTGLASVRPLVCTLLPRQGVPPSFASWAHFHEELAWGAMAGTVPEPGRWWWELRLHPGFGTLEVRVPDVQPDVEASAAVASVVHAVVGRLADRRRRGEELGVPATWRIAENRWAALRDGMHGRLADLGSAKPVPTQWRLRALLDEIEPHAPGGLDGARRLVGLGAADRLRAVGIDGALPWLADVFVP